MDAYPPPPPGGASAVNRPKNNPPDWPSPPPSSSSSTATAATPPTFAPSVTSPNSASPIRRRPLPQNASSVIPSRRPSRPSNSSLSFQGEELASPAREEVSRAVLPPSPSFEDTLPFVPRNLDRYETGWPLSFHLAARPLHLDSVIGAFLLELRVLTICTLRFRQISSPEIRTSFEHRLFVFRV